MLPKNDDSSIFRGLSGLRKHVAREACVLHLHRDVRVRAAPPDGQLQPLLEKPRFLLDVCLDPKIWDDRGFKCGFFSKGENPH